MFKKLLSALSMFLLSFTGCDKEPMKTETEKTKIAKTSFYHLAAKDITGKEVSMNQFKGKTILIVNTASKCGYTGQYKELEELYKKYSKDLVVLGFPTNDFFGQEPGTNKEIAQFCSLKYHVTFPMFEKTTTKGSAMSPIYKWLTDPAQNGWNKKKPSWNFNKYIIDKNGNLVAHFGSGESPTSKKIVDLIK